MRSSALLVVVAACSFRPGELGQPPTGDGRIDGTMAGSGSSDATTGGITPPGHDTDSSQGGSNTSSVTWTHTASGDHRLVVVGVSWGLTTTQISKVTYAGQSMMSLGSATNTTKDVNVQMFALVAPPTGAQTVAVTFGSSVPSAIGGATSFTGVDQTTPIRGFAGMMGHDQSPPASVTIASAPTDLVLDTIVVDSNPSSITVDSGQAARWTLKNGIWGGGSTKPGASSVTMGWSQSGSPDDWAIGAISIRGG